MTHVTARVAKFGRLQLPTLLYLYIYTAGEFGGLSENMHVYVILVIERFGLHICNYVSTPI